MRFGGGDLDDLIRDFERMHNDIDDDVDEVLRKNAIKFKEIQLKLLKK